jgi:hypothetical protein
MIPPCFFPPPPNFSHVVSRECTTSARRTLDLQQIYIVYEPPRRLRNALLVLLWLVALGAVGAGGWWVASDVAERQSQWAARHP